MVRRQRLQLLALAGAVLLGGLWLRAATLGAVSNRILAQARERGLDARWRSLGLRFPDRVAVDDLVLSSPYDTVLVARRLSMRVDLLSAMLLHPRLRTLDLEDARMRQTSRAADPDTLEPEPPREADRAQARSERIRQGAERLARLLLAPARELPSIRVVNLAIASGDGEDGLLRGARIARLDLRARKRGIELRASGVLSLTSDVPFEVEVDYGRDDRLAGGARLLVPPANGGAPEPLVLGLEGRVVQDRRRGEVRLEEGSRITLGELPVSLSGSIVARGPRISFALAADTVTQERVERSVPRSVLGPLADVRVIGAFDYRLRFALDFAMPDSVDFEADVIPHGLRLDPAGTRLNLLGLHRPFVAAIYLPRGVVARRLLSEENPHFRTLDQIDPRLVEAVVTNEDGRFWRHRGFNLDAVKESIAENLKAGAFRRGAGTITMQLARNLYLGHERTIARKAQEVVLAWMLEHLSGVGKHRLLEIYLNIIEWGPGVHGADEATHYYFGHDAGWVSVGEALFLSTVVPAPRKWRYRFGPGGDLRHYARAQMHFIGRAMVARGALSPESLPPRDGLAVQLHGPAGDWIRPPADSAAPPDTAAALKKRKFESWFFNGRRSI